MCAALVSPTSSGVTPPRTLTGPARRFPGARGPDLWSPAAEELLGALAQVERGARLVRARGGRTPVGSRQLVFVPAGGSMLLSDDEPRVVAAAGRRFDSTTTYRQAASMLGSRLWHTLTGGALLRDRVAVVGGSGDLAAHLSEVLGQPVTYSMSIEEAHTSRHPALQLFDARGRLVARASLGVSPASRRDLEAEATALETVASRPWVHLEAPRVLARTEWEGTDVLVRSAMRTSSWRAGGSQEPPLEAMGELSTAWTTGSVALEDMAWMHDQQRIAGALRCRQARTRLGNAVDRVLTGARRTTWPVGAWHGDWKPTTMSRTGWGRGSKVQVWSWSRFETGVPMGLDPCHFVVEATTARDGFTPRAVRAGVEDALRRQHGPGAAVLGALYLVAVSSRELVLAEGPGGHRVADRAEVLLTALEEWLDARG